MNTTGVVGDLSEGGVFEQTMRGMAKLGYYVIQTADMLDFRRPNGSVWMRILREGNPPGKFEALSEVTRRVWGSPS